MKCPGCKREVPADADGKVSTHPTTNEYADICVGSGIHTWETLLDKVWRFGVELFIWVGTALMTVVMMFWLGRLAWGLGWWIGEFFTP